MNSPGGATWGWKVDACRSGPQLVSRSRSVLLITSPWQGIVDSNAWYTQ